MQLVRHLLCQDLPPSTGMQVLRHETLYWRGCLWVRFIKATSSRHIHSLCSHLSVGCVIFIETVLVPRLPARA